MAKIIKKILIFIILICGAAAVSFYLWWAFIFFPDDYDISRSEALGSVCTEAPEIIDYCMIENIDSAILSGNFGAEKIDDIIEHLGKQQFYIRNDSFIRASRRHAVFRFGTGFAGVWLDDRSSIILPAGSSISYKIDLKQDSRLEFSAVSPGLAGTVLAEIVTASGSVVKKRVELPAYSHPYTDRDADIELCNRGYPKAVADVYWRDITIDLTGAAGPGASVSFKRLSGDGPVFIANPRIYRRAEKKRYNVIYVLMDGISNPYYSFYNENSNLTPFTKKTADEDFIIFDNMITLGDKTRISTSGLFASVLPFKTRHGINRNFIPEEAKQFFYQDVRDGRLDSLPDAFRRAGYISTQIGNSGFTVHLLSTGVDYGFDRSFEFSFNPYDSYGLSHRLFEFLKKNSRREFFLYLHYNTPHKPFFAPINYFIKGLFDSPAEAWWRPDFNGCIRYSDDVFSHIYEAFKKNGLLDNTIIVFACDHGAGIHVSRFDAGTNYMEYLRIPFMIHLPPEIKERYGITGKRVDNYVSSINAAPTLAQFAGIDVPPAFDGRSLTEVLSGKYKNDFFDDEIWSFGRKQATVITPDMYKYTITEADVKRLVQRQYIIAGDEREVPFELLYNIKNDPLEEYNLVLEKRDVLKRMRSLYLERDIHHPEKTLLAFFSDSSEEKSIRVDVGCGSQFVSYGLYNISLNPVDESLEVKKRAGGMTFVFSVKDDPIYLVFENRDDRAPLNIAVRENGRLLGADSIYATYLNLNIFGNPVDLCGKKDFYLLNEIRLPVKDDFLPADKKLSVKIMRMDLHRWIDIGRLEAKGIGAGMKQTLKSWGYIQ